MAKSLHVKIIGRLIFVSILLAMVGRVGAAVQAWEGTIAIPTYAWEDDVNPKFWSLEVSVKGSTTVKAPIIYPYTMQDYLLPTRAEKTYRAIYLENEYLRVTCLPELGGRLHSVYDKTRQSEVFYLNHVVKPDLIAMRGAWISGGVEWNAGPQVHTVDAVSPVNAVWGVNPDGSGYLEVSNLEKSLRNRWRVRLTLHPGRSFLDEQITLSNPIDAVNPYYFWNCTAFQNRQETRVIYPMSLSTKHDVDSLVSWPIQDGVDLSWLKNYEPATSIFAYHCPFDFFGAYHVDLDQGVVQAANHYEVPGKKMWTWGNGEGGRVRQSRLTDEDGPYIEVQSGPLPTQSDYGMLPPRGRISWREWWYPVHGLGEGFEYATKEIAVGRQYRDGALTLRLIATGDYRGAVCRLETGGREILKQAVDLSPTAAATITCANAPATGVQVLVASREGKTLASYESPLPIPAVEPPQPDALEKKPDEKLTLEEKYLKGLRQDRSTARRDARKYYEMALAEDGLYRPALRGLAILEFEAGLYDRTVELLNKAIQRTPNDDGLCWYFLGAGYFRRGAYDKALDSGYQAVRCLGTASLGYDLIGRAYMKQNKAAQAVKVFKQAVAADPTDLQSQYHLLMAQWSAGERAEAMEAARGLADRNPTDLAPRALTALQSSESLEAFGRSARSMLGDTEFEILELGLELAEMNLASEASLLVSAVCEKQEPPHSMPFYYLAYFSFLQNRPDESEQHLARAEKQYCDFEFASRPEEEPILAYAVQRHPNDAIAHLHLGNLYGGLGRLDEAVRHWEEASRLNPQLSVAWRNQGLYYWSQSQQRDQSVDCYRRAISARPTDQTLYYDLGEILVKDHKRSEAIELLANMPHEKPMRGNVVVLLAQTYVAENRFTEAIDLLTTITLTGIWEGSSAVWEQFRKAHIERGKLRFQSEDYTAALDDFNAAMTYPQNLGYGRPDITNESEANYWKGKALAGLGRHAEAKAAWLEGAKGHEGSHHQNQYRRMCQEAADTQQ